MGVSRTSWGDGDIGLRGKGEHEVICFDFDGLPAYGIELRGRRPSVQIEKRITRAQNAVSITADDEIFSKIVFNVWIIFSEDGLIDPGVRLGKVNLPPRSLPLVEYVEVVGQGYVKVEWIGDTAEGSAYGILDSRRVGEGKLDAGFTVAYHLL